MIKNLKKLNLNYKSGMSTLLLVFLVITIITLILFSLSLGAFLQVKKSSQIQYAQQTYYAAEGSLYETIEHMRHTEWPELESGSIEYKIGDADITRNISKVNGNYNIEILSRLMGVKRRLEAAFGHQEQSVELMDIVLVMDRSGSMAWGSPMPIEYAVGAGQTFVDQIAARGQNDRIGLISYSSSSTAPYHLDEAGYSFDDLKDKIKDLENNVGGNTNITDAIEEAKAELITRGVNPIKVMVLFSDGVTNTCADCGNVNVGSCPIKNSILLPKNPGTVALPLNIWGNLVGTCCSDYAIEYAEQAKKRPNDIIVFSILFNNIISVLGCSVDESADFGRLIMLRLSSEEPDDKPLPAPSEKFTYYWETYDPNELNNIFKEIATIISKPGFFKYLETIPKPDIP